MVIKTEKKPTTAAISVTVNFVPSVLTMEFELNIQKARSRLSYDEMNKSNTKKDLYGKTYFT